MADQDLIEQAATLFEQIETFDNIDERMDAINEIRKELHKHSPMRHEPVDCVLWVQSDDVCANDYNPNVVAPPEMELLQHSIRSDGYTMPIVAHHLSDRYEVVDGFHRQRVGKECEDIRDRIHGRLPVSVIKTERADRNDRIAATIRHNRARGKHLVDAMGEIVRDLARRNWSDNRIAKELGMEADEVLRLKQITGLADLFADQDFSEAWEVE